MRHDWFDILRKRFSGIFAGEPSAHPARGGAARGVSAPRETAGVYSMVRIAGNLALTALLIAILTTTASAAVQGDKIVNHATLSTMVTPPLHSAVTVTVVNRTPSSISFLKYSPTSSMGEQLLVPPTYYQDGASSPVAQSVQFKLLPPPLKLGTNEEIDLSAPISLVPASMFHAGEAVFVRATDKDQNLDNTVRETIVVTITDQKTGDREVLRLTESGPDTGTFLGYFQTAVPTASTFDGRVSVVNSSTINAQYVDIVDGTDTSVSAALIDPYGMVFSTLNGMPVNGATVELYDVKTGKPAAIFGDDGTSSYPSAIISGSTASDSSGKVYSFPTGTYRFPFIAPGTYRLVVTPPTGYSAPSTVPNDKIQELPGAPFVIAEPGSRGEIFTVDYGPVIHIDIPVDPMLGSIWLKKGANKTVVSTGDFIGYEITAENTDPVGTVIGTTLTDTLPSGFRYRKGSTRINGAHGDDPTISADGRTLTFIVGNLAPKSSLTIGYVAMVGSGAKPGPAINTVTAVTTAGQTTNTATATVTVQQPFLQGRSIIMGRVVVGSCGASADDDQAGMEGVGIYLEDGTFVISDRNGMFHFEGVRPGAHVVQLDLDSLPEGYRAIPCERNSRFAGRAYSQFVDLQGGTLWRADFHLGKQELQPPLATPAATAVSGSGSRADGTTTTPESPAPQLPRKAAIRVVNGEAALEMFVSRSGDLLDYRLPLQTATLPLHDLRLVVTLPPGAAYLPGSSSQDGAPLPDPEISGPTLTFRLGTTPAGWQKEIQFRTTIDRNSTTGNLESTAHLAFSGDDGTVSSSPSVTTMIAISREEHTEPLPPVTLRPHFPTFGAELSDADRLDIDKLAQTLKDKVVTRIDVVGHTDNVRIAPRSRGVYADNNALSLARARSVGRYLAALLHLPPEALFLSGSGALKPVASNGTAEGREQNRRVEITFTTLRRVTTSTINVVKERSGRQSVATRKTETVEEPQEDPALLKPPAPPLGITVERTDSPATPVSVVAAERPVPPALPPTAGPGSSPADERLSFKVVPGDGLYHYLVRLTPLAAMTGPLTITIETPPSLLYLTGSAQLNGAVIADPEVTDNTISFKLPASASEKPLNLRFRTMVEGDDTGAQLLSRVTIRGEAGVIAGTESSMTDTMEEFSRQSSSPTGESKPAASATPPSPNDNRQQVDENRQGTNSELHVREDNGIISPADGSFLASQFNAVRLVLDTALKPQLIVDGVIIPEERIGFNMKDSESGKTLYTFIGIDFGAPGAHSLQLQGIDPFGQVRFQQSVTIVRTGEISSIRLVSADNNVADGRTPVKVRVMLLDADGKPVQATAELTIKEGNLKPPMVPPTALREASTLVTVSGDGWINFQPVTTSGTYRAVLTYNKASVEVETYVKPKMRDWILVGIAEGTAGYATVTGHMENLRAADREESFYDRERLAFYSKGTIKGEWLLTMAYDSSGKKTGTSTNGLFQTIDPNAFYTIYGDGSRQQYDAASARKLYLKIEREQFYALFGDFDTGLTVTELSRYSRRMTGLKSELQGKEYELALFGSQTGQSFVKDEIRGDGTSGLYRLSRGSLVVNSESITIEARDRFKSEVIVSSRKLNRFVDYTIDYTAGTIFFKEPIQSKDEAFNPVYIVVDYEVANSGNDALTFGGRAGTRLAEGKLKAGVSYIHEGQVSGGSDLYGLDGSLQLDNVTRVRAEVATSKRDVGTTQGSGTAYLAEMVRQDGVLDGKVYYREQDEGFGLGQQKASEAGTRKFGAELAWKLNERQSVGGQAYRQYNLLTGAVRDLVEGGASYSDKQYITRAGLRYAGDRFEDGSREETVQMTVGGSWKSMNNRLTLRLDHEQSLLSPSTNVDYPTRTVLGADYQLTKEVTLIAQEELTYGAAANSTNTRFGIKSTPWSGATLSSTFSREMKEQGERTFATVGLLQKWQIDQNWSVDGGFDRNSTLRKKGGYQFNERVPTVIEGEDFTAISLGANYLRQKLAWSNRFEWRNSDREDKWGVISGLINEQGEDWGWTGKLQLLRTDGSAGTSKTDTELRLGLAYRPAVTNWILLDRLDLLSTDETSTSTSTVSRRIINNLNANYRPVKQVQIALQYGAKYVVDTIDDNDYRGYTDLMGIEGRYDITSAVDVGLRGSLLHAWGINQVNYSLAPSIGFNMMENAWINVGYNIIGFEDRDFSKGSFSSQGPFVQFRFKFDQNSLKDGLKTLNQ